MPSEGGGTPVSSPLKTKHGRIVKKTARAVASAQQPGGARRARSSSAEKKIVGPRQHIKPECKKDLFEAFQADNYKRAWAGSTQGGAENAADLESFIGQCRACISRLNNLPGVPGYLAQK